MSSSPPYKEDLLEIIGTLKRPIDFASKNNFAFLSTVKDFESFAEEMIDKAFLIGSLPKDISDHLNKLSVIFNGFDAIDDGLKKRHIGEAIVIIESIRGNLSEGGSDSKPSPQKKVLIKEPAPSFHKETTERLKKLSTPIQYLKGVGPKLAEIFFKAKGIKTVEDFLYFLPIRYEDRRDVRKISLLEVGMNGTTTGEVVVAGPVQYGRRRGYEVVITDGKGLLKLKWFNFKTQYMTRYKQGKWLRVYGMVSAYGQQKEIIHPDVEFVESGDKDEAGDTEVDIKPSEAIVPVYSKLGNLHQKTIRKIVARAVEEYADLAVSGAIFGSDAMSGCAAYGVRGRGFMPVGKAFRTAHSVSATEGGGDAEDVAVAKRSLAYDELFSLELGLALKRRSFKREDGLSLKSDGRLEAKLREALPFELTAAQEKVLAEIKADMTEPHPMNRLIQGDVGSGKTVVSLIAMLDAVEAGYQTAVMAPTEILAEQHFLMMHAHAEKLGLRVALLVGGAKNKERKELLASIAAGDVDIVVGTHALIQKSVEFKKLGLIIIDEQHRFGVEQRAALKKKGGEVSPDILVMTATPIPRTLSMTVFGDLDVSIIDELPKGRRPVETTLLREKDRQKAYELIYKDVADGAQAYIVYPLVEESEELSLKDATRMHEHLDKDIFADFTVGLLHGRMKSAEKETIMKSFKAGEIDILVSTTVIEVGVDVPNASIMMIEHAERFGLAQLHQLRGRVGRGERASQCLLLAQYTQSDETWQRLKIMTKTTDGFVIAEEDLKIRGPGDFIGRRQSGLPEFRTVDVFGDTRVLKAARDDVEELLKKDQELSSEEGKSVKSVMAGRWKGRLELAEIG